MSKKLSASPDHTAIRVALWRALHVEVDAPPPVLHDVIGLALANPDANWRQRPDMHPQGTRGYRASIVGRTRVVEDLVASEIAKGVQQFVILGAGLDTFAQRHPELANQIRIFEIDQPTTQEWKQQRLNEIGLPTAPNLHFVPVDFEAGESWLEKLKTRGFDAKQPAVIASTGVSLYLSKEANLATLRQISTLAPGSTLAMTFMLPLAMVDADEQAQYQMVQDRARAAGTPFVSFFAPAEMIALARQAGFKTVEHMAKDHIVQRYFAGRGDGLKPASGEEFVIARTTQISV